MKSFGPRWEQLVREGRTAVRRDSCSRNTEGGNPVGMCDFCVY